MRQILVLLGCLALMSAAQAQTGPTTARVISRPMPSKAPAAPVFSAEAQLAIDTDGEVDSATIVASSGDAAFDKQWTKSLEDWRFVPAVDANGQPSASTLSVVYKNTGLTIGVTAGNAVTESERIDRMSCKDFVWEYTIVTDALPRRLALLDPLLKTPRIMWVAESRPTEEQAKKMNEGYDQVINDVAKHCRDNPGDALWKAVLKPAMEAALASQ